MKLAPIALELLATASLASRLSRSWWCPHLLDAARNPEHIRGLPAEVRNALAHSHGARCTVCRRFSLYFARDESL